MQFLNLQVLLSFIAILVDYFFLTSLLCFVHGTSPRVSLVDLWWDQIAFYMVLSLSSISSFYFSVFFTPAIFLLSSSCEFISKDSCCLLQMVHCVYLLDFQAQCWDDFLFLLFQVIKLYSIFDWLILTSQVYFDMRRFFFLWLVVVQRKKMLANYINQLVLNIGQFNNPYGRLMFLQFTCRTQGCAFMEVHSIIVQWRNSVLLLGESNALKLHEKKLSMHVELKISMMELTTLGILEIRLNSYQCFLRQETIFFFVSVIWSPFSQQFCGSGRHV